jgi:hypothetical protein
VTILYVETNLLVGVATGRDRDLQSLLAFVDSGLRLVIPSVCFFESLTWMEGEYRRRTEFERLLRDQIGQLKRDTVSIHARSLRTTLARSQKANRALLNGIDSRLFSAMADVSQVAEWIAPDPTILERSRNTAVIGELTDDLILQCILRHAARFPGETRLFLSANTRDFGGVAARRVLREAGIEPIFTQISDVLGWLRATPGL